MTRVEYLHIYLCYELAHTGAYNKQITPITLQCIRERCVLDDQSQIMIQVACVINWWGSSSDWPRD
jgi:hypothetical protein